MIGKEIGSVFLIRQRGACCLALDLPGVAGSLVNRIKRIYYIGAIDMVLVVVVR